MKKLYAFILTCSLFISFGFSTPQHDVKDDGVVASIVVITPNPAKTTARISIKDSKLKIEAVAIYSILGDIEYYEKIASPSSAVSVNVSRLKSGKYFVKLSMDNQSTEVATLFKE